ncbi:MAG: peptidoglycan editing factor PgeF [Pseudomonadales bacterium]|nr:peptidoglycan editing factor PgeF [Pseudomonadales bacterium]
MSGDAGQEGLEPEYITSVKTNSAPLIVAGEDFFAPNLSSIVGAVTTTRRGGVSSGIYASFNLGDHVGDVTRTVIENRAILADLLGLDDLRWVQQVHGVQLHRVNAASARVENAASVASDAPVVADALWTDQKRIGLCIMTADCLPIFVSDRLGRVVAMVHGGWRSLIGGILQNLAQTLSVELGNSRLALKAWIGPSISFSNYPVGEEILTQIAAAYGSDLAKHVCRKHAKGLHADLLALAAWCLQDANIDYIGNSGLCNYADQQFYSYRRSRRENSELETGRMASVIWLK